MNGDLGGIAVLTRGTMVITAGGGGGSEIGGEEAGFARVFHGKRTFESQAIAASNVS